MPTYVENTSRVDPLPHQLESVYHYLLKLPGVRFLLADNAGAGKPVHEKLFVVELDQGYRKRILAVFGMVFGIMRASPVWR